jgi:hypothetical protein
MIRIDIDKNLAQTQRIIVKFITAAAPSPSAGMERLPCFFSV